MTAPIPPILISLSLGLLLAAVSRAEDLRDPFWPIGETPVTSAATPEPTPKAAEAPSEPPPPRELTDEELRLAARKLSADLTKSFTRSATAIVNGKIKAHIESDNIVSKNPWISEGEFFMIELQGQRYQMEVVTLTRNHIELVPHRVSAPSTRSPK